MKARKRHKHKFISRLLSVFLLCSLLIGTLPPWQAQAAAKKLSVATAKSMALAQSSDYTKLKNKLALAKVQYTQSVKSIKLKEKNQKTFRWSPLLNFKFPEKPDLADEFEYTYKPLELQSQIDVLNHSLSDCIYGIYEKVELAFLKVYVLQEKISYNEKRIDSYQGALNKNKARLLAGQANQTDVDTMEKKLETLNSTLASDKRNFEAEKEKLGLLIGVDLSTSYEFQSPFVTASLDRMTQEELIAHTLEYDDAYYQARTASANGLLELNTNYRLMQNQYGSKMRMIDSFINQAKKGEKLDSAAFKLKYGELLDAADQPWQGKKRILFIKIPKEWFKGAIDGIRYVEDEPYALYESAVEYQGLYAEELAMKKDLTASVKEYYENYVSTMNSSQSLAKEVAKKENELKKAAYLNGTGKMTYEEYTQVQEEYEELQMDYLDAKAAHSEILYTFDRLTCGALSAYLKGEAIELSSSEGGKSYVVEDEGEGIYYFIHSMVENNIFELGLSVPENFEIGVSDYELWVDNMQVGTRTAVNKTIRHLALDMEEVDRVFIRLYDGDTFVDDCDIDPSVYSEKLLITNYRIETTGSSQIGSYTAKTNSATGMLEFKITLNPDQMAEFYNIKTADGKYLVSDKKIPVKDKFSYLAAAEGSLEDLTICLYDKSGALLFEARPQSADQTLQKKED